MTEQAVVESFARNIGVANAQLNEYTDIGAAKARTRGGAVVSVATKKAQVVAAFAIIEDRLFDLMVRMTPHAAESTFDALGGWMVNAGIEAELEVGDAVTAYSLTIRANYAKHIAAFSSPWFASQLPRATMFATMGNEITVEESRERRIAWATIILAVITTFVLACEATFLEMSVTPQHIQLLGGGLGQIAASELGERFGAVARLGAGVFDMMAQEGLHVVGRSILDKAASFDAASVTVNDVIATALAVGTIYFTMAIAKSTARGLLVGRIPTTREASEAIVIPTSPLVDTDESIRDPAPLLLEGHQHTSFCSGCNVTAPTDTTCSRCDSVSYCSQKCRDSDWDSGHSVVCAAAKAHM